MNEDHHGGSAGLVLLVIAAAIFLIWLASANAQAQSTAQMGRYRCVISVDGVQVHTSTYSNLDNCLNACSVLAVGYAIRYSKQSVVNRCIPD